MSAVLRSITEVLPSRRAFLKHCFDRTIYIDCSQWKNRRAVQRAIVEQLKLDRLVMASMDKRDEEDDFNGVDESLRNEIDSVGQVIYKTLRGNKSMMIFLNGSDDEVDVSAFGFPLTRFDNNIVIWTFKKSFLSLHPRSSVTVQKLRYTHYFISFLQNIKPFQAMIREEARTIVTHNPCMMDIDPSTVADCILYEKFLHYSFNTTTKFCWVSHASNYWVSDGIIQEDIVSDIINALHQEISWGFDPSFLDDDTEKLMKHLDPPLLVIKDGDVYEERPHVWMSVTSKNRNLHGLQTIPTSTSSFILAFERSDHPPTLPNGLFEHSNKLGVIVFYCCAFNFASPPFLMCHRLRFLGLDCCTNEETIEAENHVEWSCLYSLRVLDIRYKEWNEILSTEKMGLMTNIIELNIEGVRCWQYTAQLQGRLPNLQRLRVIKPTSQWDTSEDVDNSFIDKRSMEILDLSGNCYMKILPSLSIANRLQMLILDGCDGLENIGGLGRLPPSLRSFSFDAYGPASQRTPKVELPAKHFRPSTTEDAKDISTSKISLEGCTELDNLFLRGLNNLVELDLSGTAIKILDFKTMVVQVPRLKRLFLIGCKHLRAITSVQETDLKFICIDTRARIVCPRPSINNIKSFRLQLHAIIVDARLSRSLLELLSPYMERDAVKEVYFDIHVTSPMYDGVVQFDETKNEKFEQFDKGSLQQLISAGQYSDVLSMVGFPPMQAFPQPPATRLDRHIEISKGSCYVESELESDEALGDLIAFSTESLHLHDVSIRVPVTIECRQNHLRRCRVERCPELDTVFHCGSWGLSELETFWASDLLMARCIWSKDSFHSSTHFLNNLEQLHLHSCPRLQFVLPVWFFSFPALETLHVVHCGDLVHVFEPEGQHREEIISLGVLFPKLASIHLHDLPKLHQICEVKMAAPALDTIRIRGCWGLRRLPSVAARAQGEKKPTVEIEKDVWDALEWDVNHRSDHFEMPVHSRYYKKKLPRVSYLR